MIMSELNRLIYELRRHAMFEELKLAIQENKPDRLKYIDIQNCMNLRFDGGITPLNYALSLKREHIAQTLIDNGVDFKQSDSFHLDDERKRYPIHYAAESGLIAILDLLVRQKNVDINEEDFNGNTALNYGVRSGNVGEYRINKMHKSGENALTHSIRVVHYMSH